MSHNESKNPRNSNSKQDTESNSSENEDSKKKSKKNHAPDAESNDESYHTATSDEATPTESQIEEPISQFFLRPLDKTRSSIVRKTSIHDKEEENRPSIEERDKDPSPAQQELQPSESSSDIDRIEKTSTVRISPLTTDIPAADIDLEPGPLLAEGASTVERDNLFQEHSASSSFRTNLEPGLAFVYMVLPPDGGYGWVIVFVSFLIQTIVDGIIYSIGITLPYMAEDFNVGQSEIIFVSALQVSFYFLSGPITSAIINKYGFRKVAFAGASLSFMNLLIASFSPNLEMMLVFYSALGGPTLSMVWVSSQLIVGYYFDKYRPIASGLTCSGTGAGLVIFVLMNANLVPTIGWRNLTRIHASLMIIVLLLSLAFLEVAPSKIGIIREAEHQTDESSENEHVVKTVVYGEPSTSHDRDPDFMSLEKLHPQDLKIYKPKREGPCAEFCRRRCTCVKDYISDTEDDGIQKAPKRYVIKKDLIEKQDLYYTGPAEYTEQDKSFQREVLDGQNVELIAEQKPVEAINYAFSMHAARRSVSEDPKRRKCVAIPNKMKKSFAILFDFKLFRIMEFQILFTSAFLFSLAVNIPFLFSKERLDLPPQLASLIPMIIGGATFCSRIICGLIAFKFRTHVGYLCGGAITFGGSMVFLSAFYGHDMFWFQALYAVLFGIAPAFFSTLRAIIYVQYLGLENLTNAFGLIGMGMGIAVFLGTVIGGVLNDVTDGYVASFALAGLCIMGSGILKLILAPLNRRGLKVRKVKFQL